MLNRSLRLPMMSRLLANLLAMTIKLILCACLSLTVTRLQGQPNSRPDPKFWITDGPVNAILVTNNTVYIGGDFSYVGPQTGPVALFDQTTGQLVAAPARINGAVNAVVPDGNGGWFVGGAFTGVGGVAVTNLAHLNADLTLDVSWNARVVGSTVNALVLDSGRLYIGGTFSKINGQPTTGGLAAVAAANAAFTSTWAPQLGGTVNAMRLTNGLLYVGGTFYSVGSSNNQNLAAISTTTGLATGWRPDPDTAVYALDVSGNNVYVGGANWTTIGTRAKHYLAVVDATTGVAASTWNPNPSGIVRAIVVSGSTAYVGGDFTSISVTSRRGFAAISATGLGAAQPLDLQLQSLGTMNLVRSIILQSNSLYVGGSFTNAFGGAHVTVVGVDVTTSLPLPTPLGTDFNGTAGTSFGGNALVSTGNTILVGGDFRSIGGVPRRRAAALSFTTGAALPWAPSFDAPVLSLAYTTNRLYVGGSFTNFNTTNALPILGRGLAAVDPATGNPITAFSFQGTNGFSAVSVNALAVSSDTLYVGGAFTVVADQQRRYLAAVDLALGSPRPLFNANLTGGGTLGVTSLVLAQTNLYVGGDFTAVNGVAIPRLAALSPSNGTAGTNWTPTSDTLYVGGTFNQIAGISLRNFAAFSLADNSLIPVDAALPNFAQGVNAIGATPTTLYIGGSFDSIGGAVRQNLGNLSSFAGAYDWDPAPDQPPSAIALTDQFAFIGGPFRFLGRYPTNQANGFLTVFSRAPQIIAISSTPTNTFRITTTTGDRTDAVIQAVTNLGDTWENVATNTAPGSSWTMDFPIASPPMRFFRVGAR
jgi:hypothetical protein